jgi:two-component SAPR family response regulator
VRVEDAVTVDSESVRFQRQLGEAARLQGEQRLQATLDALSLYDRGPYLPGQRALWADARQEVLAEAASEARYQAAVLSFNAGTYDEARRLALEVLQADPYREAAWRLLMRVTQALGDEDAVIRAFQECEEALGRLGTTASPQTRQLLEQLRR